MATIQDQRLANCSNEAGGRSRFDGGARVSECGRALLAHLQLDELVRLERGADCVDDAFGDALLAELNDRLEVVGERPQVSALFPAERRLRVHGGWIQCSGHAHKRQAAEAREGGRSSVTWAQRSSPGVPNVAEYGRSLGFAAPGGRRGLVERDVRDEGFEKNEGLDDAEQDLQRPRRASTPSVVRCLVSLMALGLVVACTSARVTATLDGEPVCSDFEVGAAKSKLKGALRRPVKVTVLDGKTTVSERIVLGKRSEGDLASVLVVQDENETYTVRFAQCGNDFAPQPIATSVDKDAKRRDDFTTYDCGDAAVYKEIQVEVKAGKPETRVISWQTPPETACLGSSHSVAK